MTGPDQYSTSSAKNKANLLLPTVSINFEPQSVKVE